LQYPVDHHTAIFTISWVLAGISGIITAIVLNSKNQLFKPILKYFVTMFFISFIAGTVSMIFALGWVSKSSNANTLIAVIALIVQVLSTLLPLGVLIQTYWKNRK
jgi:hypothetical protein